ncbi:unnamed protein product [Mytilus edulis]|uniref:Uncharacterized protein n=1 Tax=Mytilus edulis TaxID=6550 RepID=A0A8S3VM59_MYTED|nr:unnamed protein product [Mytilus edulis]
MSCGYCGDPPAKHQNLQQHVSSSTASSSTQNVTLSSNIVEAKQSGGATKLSTTIEPWMNKKFGYISDPKRKTGQFYNTVLKSLYESFWPYCDNLERLIHNASKLEQKVVTEIEKISKDNDSLFCQNGRLKSGRQSQHNFNEDTIHKMNIFIADEIKPFNKTLVELKQKCKVTSWNKRGKKELINKENERTSGKLKQEQSAGS